MGIVKGYVDCKICQGTGLRWPTLSRECEDAKRCGPSRDGWVHLDCHGSGRVPDVTLENVLAELFKVWPHGVKFWEDEGIYGCYDEPGFNWIGDTPLEAACDALLAL